MKFTSKFIDEALFDKYLKSAKYIVSNIYAFNSAYGETDFFVANSSGYCYDIEIKVTRADFKADFKKRRKHSILKSGTYRNNWETATQGPLDSNNRRTWLHVKKHKDIQAKQYPNRFYFAVPEGLISVDEVPDYAGLIYVDEYGNVSKVKEGKLLHKTKMNVEKLLCTKFYHRMLNAKNALEICKG